MTTEERLAQSIGVPIEIKQVPIGKHTINYITAGSGRPLLLIHGANIGWGQWYKNIAELSRHFKIYAIDLPGAGRSSRVNYAIFDPYKDLLDIVKNFIHQFNLDRLNAVGSSIGGWIVMQLALTDPARMRRIVLVNSVGFADYMGIGDKIIGMHWLAKLIARIILRPVRTNRRVEQFLRHTLCNRNFPLENNFIDYFYETMSTSHNLLFISRLSQLTKQLLLSNRLQEIKNPSMIIWGEKDPIMPLQKNEHNFWLIPGVKVCIIKDAGHFPSVEKAEEFNSAVKIFLEN